MNPDFYRAFEGRHRGSRDLIKSRLRFYLPFVEPLRTLHGSARLLDLGCGRGEWLELACSCGLEASGVDLDSGMLDACSALGLNAKAGDALQYLKQTPSESQSVISGFHIAEHLPFSDLLAMIHEALRALKPAGLLILETPNPENLIVGTSAFYLDPTHNKPLPPPLLSFAIEFAGFHRFKTVRLQQDPRLATQHDLGLVDVLGGVSPDYAIIAQKVGSVSELTLWDAVFDQDYGCTLDDLAARYDGRLMRVETLAAQAMQGAQAVTASAHEVAQQTEAAIRQMQMAVVQAFEAAAEAQANAVSARKTAESATMMAQQATAVLRAIERSGSWRVTAPLRWVRRLMQRQSDPVARKDTDSS